MSTFGSGSMTAGWGTCSAGFIKKTKFSWYGGSGQDVTIFQFRGIIFRSWHKFQGQLKSKLLVLAGECVKSLLN